MFTSLSYIHIYIYECKEFISAGSLLILGTTRADAILEICQL